MKIGENDFFLNLSKLLIEFYDTWTKQAKLADTPRAFVWGTNREDTTCLMIFKGNKEDAMEAKKFIEKRKKKE